MQSIVAGKTGQKSGWGGEEGGGGVRGSDGGGVEWVGVGVGVVLREEEAGGINTRPGVRGEQKSGANAPSTSVARTMRAPAINHNLWTDRSFDFAGFFFPSSSSSVRRR